MAAKKYEAAEGFIEADRKEEKLWNVRSFLYKDRTKKELAVWKGSQASSIWKSFSLPMHACAERPSQQFYPRLFL